MRSARDNAILGKIHHAGINSSGNNIYMIYFNGQAFQAFSPAINTWIALRYTRALNAAGTGWVYYYFVNGDLVMARDSGILGDLDFSGGRIGWVANKGAHAYIDEIRLSAICRGTTNYTVDNTPFLRQ
jgi:hypothetical protein